MAYVSSLSTMLNKICFTLEIVQPESLCILLMEGSKNISLDTVEALPSMQESSCILVTANISEIVSKDLL